MANWSNLNPKHSLALVVVTLLLSTTSCAMPDPPSTPYAVGVKTLFIHDKSRPYDAVAGVDKGVRSLITEVWYPVSHKVIAQDQAQKTRAYPRAKFGDYSFARSDVHHKMMTQTTFFHLTPDTVIEGVDQQQISAAINELFHRERNSFRDAPLAETKQAFPIVVMTHGDAGSRYNMETVCEYLAAHGYVVIAPEHTGNTPFAQTGEDPALAGDYENAEVASKMREIVPLLNDDGTYGAIDNYGQSFTPLASGAPNAESFIQLDQALVERVNDLRAALATLEQWNSKGEFANRLNMDQVGVMGRSFGGMTTLAALGLEDQFSAGVAVVPLVFPDVRPALQNDLTHYSPRESALLNQNGTVVMNTLQKPTLLLSGAQDALIIGSGVRMQQAFGGPVPSASNPHAQLRESFELSNQPVYWGMLENSNHSSFGVSGGYWWPHLKPSTQKRTFNPEQDFNLISPIKAHSIQRDRVLHFFDVYLKQVEASKALLHNNPFAEQGFSFEYRNTRQ